MSIRIVILRWQRKLLSTPNASGRGVQCTETVLFHREIAEKYLPAVCEKLMQNGVEIRGCDERGSILQKLRLLRKKTGVVVSRFDCSGEGGDRSS
jgi:hypothetical protein